LNILLCFGTHPRRSHSLTVGVERVEKSLLSSTLFRRRPYIYYWPFSLHSLEYMSGPVTLKRKRDEDTQTLNSAKRLCKDVGSPPSHLEPVTSEPKSIKTAAPMNSETPSNPMAGGGEAVGRNATKVPFKPRPKIVKLNPHRPYPSVPTSSSATGPRSKRKEGNNKICITRRTDLGAYLSRCKDLFVKEGYVLHICLWTEPYL
jgi:hypothetical protein